MIGGWEEFEAFPWDEAYRCIEEYVEYLEVMGTHLPDGMKVGVVGTLFEEPLEWIFGYEGLFYLLHDAPDLVEAVFQRVGKIMHAFYEAVLGHGSVGCAFHADDLGFRTGTLVSVDTLKDLVFPWFKGYAELAHAREKPFYLHSCGNKERIMDTLIDWCGIDGIHAFEDASSPVMRYKRRWGDRVGIMGGVDVDRLVRSDEQSLRRYVRQTLDACMEGGRYVFGSGNSITNYIPVENYLIMIDEAAAWR
jgi:uroporphyrinogen decarboxylase